MPSIETLPFLVKQLRLPAIANHWQERTRLAEKERSGYGDYLAGLLELELVLREQNRLARAYKNARLPAGKPWRALHSIRQSQSIRLRYKACLKMAHGLKRLKTSYCSVRLA